jgi:hypothetical protein
MLLPIGAGTVANEVVATKLIETYGARAGEMASRLSQIYDALERIEFVFYCTPKGDLIVEFPLYDFDPLDFKEFCPNYIAELEEIFSSSSPFSDAAVRTMVTVDVSLSNMPDAIDARAFPPIVITRPALFPTYGTRSEPANLRGLVRTQQAAIYFGQLFLNRINADMHSVNLPILPRFELGLNKPLLWKGRNHIGTTMSVVHNIQWNGSWRTTAGLSHLRGWTGQLDTNGNMLYVPIAEGGESRGINYKILFSRGDPPATPDLNEAEVHPQVNTEPTERPQRTQQTRTP